MFVSIADEGVDAVIVLDQPENVANRRLIVELLRKRLLRLTRTPTASD